MEQEEVVNPVFLAKTNFRDGGRIFGIKNNDRFQHMYVIGQTGTGKTTLLKNTAIQDIEAGKGIAVIDPHGEFVDELLLTIPDERLDDVIYFNPYDVEYPMGFNVLEVKNPDHRHLVASGLMSIFTKIWANVWSARMEYIMNNCVLALLDTPGTTLLGIPRMLVDKVYRQTIVNNLRDPVVRSFWINEYEQYTEKFRNEAIAPIQNKVGQFLSTPLVRNVVGQSKSALDIDDIMNSGKILLVNVSKGKIGEDNSALIGAMLITKMQLSAMERVLIPEKERRDFFLYVDEFQNFATDSFASVLSEARKYRLGLVISHQYIGQLATDGNTTVQDAIFGNVGTTITFRVGATDAEFLEKHYEPEVLGQDLINLPNYQVYMKLLIDGVGSRPFSASTLPPIDVDLEESDRTHIIKNVRKNYASRREDVENEIAMWSGMRTGAATAQPSSEPSLMSANMSSGKVYSDDKKKKDDEKATISKPIRPSMIAPQFKSNLADLGIDVGDEDIVKYQEVERDMPEEVSLSELGGGEEKPKRKRKRKRKKKTRSETSDELRETLSGVLGYDAHDHTPQPQEPQQEPSAEATVAEFSEFNEDQF